MNDVENERTNVRQSVSACRVCRPSVRCSGRVAAEFTSRREKEQKDRNPESAGDAIITADADAATPSRHWRLAERQEIVLVGTRQRGLRAHYVMLQRKHCRKSVVSQ